MTEKTVCRRHGLMLMPKFVALTLALTTKVFDLILTLMPKA